jgi:oligopeptide/dipeptide ABC transporter ATP-binding protein
MEKIHARSLSDATTPTLLIERLSIAFETPHGRATVVDDVSIRVGAGEIVGLIGESGSGKTIVSLAVLGMLPRGAKVLSGAIGLSGDSLLDKPENYRRAIRGDRVALIPQEALRALNPTLRVGLQVGEPLTLHRGTPWAAAKRRAVELLKSVELREPARRAEEYPHQFSGGMQQRAMIAMGLSLEPELLIADEPTTALDVTVQAQVLSLLRGIRESHGTSILFITHDLGVVAELCDRVYVMYAGAIVEEGPVARIFAMPSHPYTRGLLLATPRVHGAVTGLTPIPGQIPLPTERPPGCRFRDRCAFAEAACGRPPPAIVVEADHVAYCVKADRWEAGP